MSNSPCFAVKGGTNTNQLSITLNLGELLMKKYEQIHRFYENMEAYGFTIEESDKLRRIAMTLSRWCERECNGEIERDEATQKPFYVIQSIQNKRYATADKEAGALKRLKKIIDIRNAREKDEVVHYYQGDPRGCSLYILRKADIRKDERIDSIYTRGIAVCY